MRCFFDINDERDRNGIDLPAKAIPEQARRLVLAVALEEFRLGGQVNLAVRDQADQQIYIASLTIDGRWTASASDRAI
jgi:hypothetical protein